ncbi:hypothetical protein [Paenibacillus xerothermodurans]|uniref:hypothetical protein n=1 Tax=Paenibacillus xerothermodurans TaxID=1977292 RepID=UPI001FB5527F|nr:hypothetical protein [Paenibacillus xerothermodurans]
MQKIWSALSEHQPSLYPAEEWDELLDIRISKLALPEAVSEQLTYVRAVKAGLHLLNESLDHSHELSQNIDNPTGSYWHAIMHRMEGDYGNAKYWFRLVGTHPVFAVLHEQARTLCEGFELSSIQNASLRGQLETLKVHPNWDPDLFTDLVRHQVTVAQEDQVDELLREIQWREMKLLLQFAMERTGGKLLEL